MLKTEFIAATETGSKRLLVALHGLGDSAVGYRWLPDELRLPWLNYLLVNAPDPYYGGYSWYDFAGDTDPGIKRSRALLWQLLDKQRQAGFAAEEITLFGFSQGCVMIIELGFRYPHRLAGLVGVSGYVHDPELLLAEQSPVASQQRLLFTHGTMDPLIPCVRARAQAERLKAAGLAVTWVEFPKAHTIPGQAELDTIRDFIRAGYAQRPAIP